VRLAIGLCVLLVAGIQVARMLSPGQGAAAAKRQDRSLFAALVAAPAGSVTELEQEARSSSPLLLVPWIVLLGATCSVASCCNIAIMGALAGYAGSQPRRGKWDGVVAALCLVAGTVLLLSLTGALIGVPGQFLVSRFGFFGRLFTGGLLVLFGLFSLGLLPLGWVPSVDYRRFSRPAGWGGAVVFGFALSAASMTCSLTCCSPALPMVLGVASLAPRGMTSLGLTAVFGLGYSVPLALALLGISYGTWTLCRSRLIPWIRRIAGVVMLALGFYFLF
jgi:cytochrome c biogenesis protein CcdA